MKRRVRIVEHKNRYYLQRKVWFFWVTKKSRLGEPVSFFTKAGAVEYVLETYGMIEVSVQPKFGDVIVFEGVTK